jgi:endonuclease/exonuclease/phosphatase family metal-dependent hydrolase
MIIRSFLSPLLLTLVVGATQCFAQQSPAECADGKCIQVASYNLELFGSDRSPYGGDDRGPRSDSSIDQIAKRIIADFDFEVIVFQEINTASGEWNKLKQKLAANGYKFKEGQTSDRNQFVVLAWDADEIAIVDDSARELNVRTSFDLADGCSDDGLRKPVAGRFQANNFDFWVIGVHLKSRVGAESCTQAIRTEQTCDLVNQIKLLETDSGESDFILVGDFNELHDHASFDPLTEAGFKCQMQFLAPDSGNGSYLKTGSLHQSKDLIDHVWLRYSRTQELVRKSATVMKLTSVDAAKRYIIEQSDHVPVWMSFRNDEDLDDND